MIDHGLVASLRAVHEALGTHRIPYAIFGARVLELRATEVSRARLDLPETVDVDLAVIVSSWAEFDRAKKALGRAGFEPTEIEHRF